MRGRNNNNGNNNNGNRKAPNPLQRSYESNGPDVKVRGTAQHVAEKYLQLARDAQSSSDPVAAENYFQHAEHYYRILLAAQEQMSQQFGHSFPPARGFVDDSEEGDEDGDDDMQGQPGIGPQPDLRNGYNGNHGPRQEAEGGEGQRFDRQPRQDRNQNDRNQNDRVQNDRAQNDRPQNDRYAGDRNPNDRQTPRRFERNDRPERNDRGERRFDRPEGGQPQQGGQHQQGGYAPRTEAPRADPRPETSRPEAQPVLAEQPEAGFAPRESERRFERPRPERRPRREIEPAADADEGAPTGLPSFVTTPVRVPIAVGDDASPADQSASEDGDGAPRRTRRRRSPREVMDALGSETDTAAE